MLPLAQHGHRKTKGFSLVELMVGMVIGLLGIVIMMQVSTLFHAQRNSTSSGAKAQNNGAIALFTIQRDVEQAGYGISTMPIIGCNVQLRPGVTLGPMAPLLINDNSIPAGDPNTDTILVAFSNTPSQTEGDSITNHAALNTYTVGAPLTFNVGDSVIAQVPTRQSPCNLALDTVTAIDAPSATLTVASGTPAYTPSPSAYGTLYNLGPASSIKVHAYAVRGGVLTECDFMLNDCSQAASVTDASIWVPIADNVVSLRAQYGRDTTAPNMDGTVDKYDQVPPNTACKLARIPAMRMAVVVRNSQFQKQVVTTTASNTGAVANFPQWAGDQIDPIVGGGGALGPGTAPDEPWKHYRYRVFETSVPRRTVAWMGAVSGC